MTNDALILGDNDGEHTDTFQAGSMLGNQGIQIRDSSGKLVPWSVEIVDIQDGNALIDVRISKPEVLATIERSPIVLLENQSLSAHVFLENDCELEINSRWSPSESDRLVYREFFPSGNYSLTSDGTNRDLKVEGNPQSDSRLYRSRRGSCHICRRSDKMVRS